MTQDRAEILAWVKERVEFHKAEILRCVVRSGITFERDCDEHAKHADHFTAIAALLETDMKLREVIQQEVDSDNTQFESLMTIISAAGLWPKGEQVP